MGVDTIFMIFICIVYSNQLEFELNCKALLWVRKHY